MRKFSKIVFMLVIMLSILCTFAVAQAANFNWSPINVEGDTIYLPSQGSFGVGIGSNLATFKDTVELRGMLVSSVDKVDVNMAGIGIGVNLPNIIAKLGGAWLLDNLNTSIGVTGLTNLNGKAHIQPAIYLTVVSVSY